VRNIVLTLELKAQKHTGHPKKKGKKKNIDISDKQVQALTSSPPVSVGSGIFAARAVTAA